MCGRYTLHSRREAIADAFDLDDVPELPLRYNIAPTQDVTVVRLDPDAGTRRLASLRWGLIPSWADDPAIGSRMINARAETVASKPAFRSAFKRRRCLVLADGFYEWSQSVGGKTKRLFGKNSREYPRFASVESADDRSIRSEIDRRSVIRLLHSACFPWFSSRIASKTPFHFRLRDRAPFAFAGLWETWEMGPQPVESCTLITTEPNAVVAPVHDRMPAILRPEAYAQWLDPAEQGADELGALLAPLPDALLEGYPVGRLVNSPSNDDPRCIDPAG